MVAHDGASSSSSFGSSSTHDVFLSFRGEDTRNIFTGFLHSALKREGINVFIDSEGLWGGEEIQTALLDAIQQSKILIPIFSKGYADSKWCLMELVEIIQCHRSNDKKVLPIFLDVEPRDVRHQTGSFEGSFQKHMERYDAQKIQSWKDALTQVAGKKGYELKQVNGNQPELVKLIVDWALSELSSNRLSDVKNPVGLDARVEDLLSRLKVDSNDVRCVGICGIGGMGKTTIAKTLYNRIFKNFEMSCFLANVREEASSGPNGVVSLHEKLIYSVSKREVKICNIDRGQQLIKEKLQGKKVLLILDDVDSYSQLKDLAIEIILFGPGSRIIITSRDEHIPNMAKVDGDIYCPKELNDEQSLQLFSLHAFSSDQPPEDYIQLSREMIQLAGGLPLTLEVLGSSLFGIREKEVWQSMSQELKRIPHDDVYRQLRISYDKLNDNEKSIFLDAACIFVRWRKEKVISFWDACGFNPLLAIKKLTQRSLLKFTTNLFSSSDNERLWMHDQIQAMGRRIVYEENPMEPSKRSRLWSIKEPEGAQMHEIILWPLAVHIPHLYRRDFAMMSKLRLLEVHEYSTTPDFLDFPHLPPNLKWFIWNDLKVPANFYHKKLVRMELINSQIREAWINKPHNENERFQKLKVLNLQHCSVSHEPLDFSWFPCLETLNLRNCINMVKLHKSIGDLKSLVELNLMETRIEELPNSICSLSSLKVLHLSNCPSLKNLPESIGDLKSLVELDLGGKDIEELPNSFCSLSSLKVLDLTGCKGSRISLPWDDYGILLPSLVDLSIGNNLESSFPPWISCLPQLRELHLTCCTKLESIPDLPSTLTTLEIYGCDSLQTLPDLSSLKHLRSLWISGCEELKEIRGFEGTESLEKLEVYDCETLRNTQKWKIRGQGTLLVDEMSWGNDYYTLNINDAIAKGLIIFCVVFDLQGVDDEFVEEGEVVYITLSITVNLCRHQKLGRIICCTDVKIEGCEYTARMRDIIYVHHFKGFDWFGIPLQPGFDAIEVTSVSGKMSYKDMEASEFEVKFWKVLLESTASEQQQQITNQEEEESITTTARRMTADFFNWSDDEDDEDHGRSHHFVPTQQVDSSTHKTIHHFTSSSNAMEIEGSNPVVTQQADQESSNEMIDSHNDLRLGLGLPMIDSQCDMELLLGLTDQGGGQAGRVAEDPNLSQQALGLSPERLWRAGKRPRLDMDDAGPSRA